MNIFTRAAPPFLTAGHQLQFDHTFSPKSDGYDSVQTLYCRRHENSRAFAECSLNLWSPYDLGKMGRANLLFPLGDQHQVHREFASGTANGVKSSQQRGLWALLIHRATSHDH